MSTPWPSAGETRAGELRNRAKGLKSLVGIRIHEEFITWKLEPSGRYSCFWRYHPDREGGRSSLASPLLPPPTSIQWLPVGKASWHESLGNSGCKGSKNPYLQEEDYLQNKVDNIGKKIEVCFGTKPTLQPLSTYQAGLQFHVWYCSKHRCLTSKWLLIELPIFLAPIRGLFTMKLLILKPQDPTLAPVSSSALEKSLTIFKNLWLYILFENRGSKMLYKHLAPYIKSAPSYLQSSPSSASFLKIPSVTLSPTNETRTLDQMSKGNSNSIQQGRRKNDSAYGNFLYNKNHKVKFFQGSKQVTNEKGSVRARLASCGSYTGWNEQLLVKLSWLYPDRLLLFFPREAENIISFSQVKLWTLLIFQCTLKKLEYTCLPSKTNHIQVRYGALRLPVYGTCFIGNMHNLRNLEPIFAKIRFWIKRKKRILLPQEVCLRSRIGYYLL